MPKVINSPNSLPPPVPQCLLPQRALAKYFHKLVSTSGNNSNHVRRPSLLTSRLWEWQPENMLFIHGRSSHVCLQGPTLSKCAIGGCMRETVTELWNQSVSNDSKHYVKQVLLFRLHLECCSLHSLSFAHNRVHMSTWSGAKPFLRSGSSARRVDSVDKVVKPKQHSIHFHFVRSTKGRPVKTIWPPSLHFAKSPER